MKYKIKAVYPNKYAFNPWANNPVKTEDWFDYWDIFYTIDDELPF